MKPELEDEIHRLVDLQDADELIRLVKHYYEFKCPSFIYAGPGHQSKHTCNLHYPHDLDGEHENHYYEWTGTSVQDPQTGQLVFNAPHHGSGCCC